MLRCWPVVLILLLGSSAPGAADDPDSRPLTTALRFEASLGPGLVDGPLDGRLLLVLDPRRTPQPWRRIGEVGVDAPAVLGCDVQRLTSRGVAVVDQAAKIFPLEHLAQLRRGDYRVQAVLEVNPDLKVADAPGNLCSEPLDVHLDPARGQTVRLGLSRRFAEADLPALEHIQWVKIRSARLSRFFGRPMYLRAGVLLPPDYDRDTTTRYPLCVHIGGYGTRCTAVAGLMQVGSEFRKAWLDPNAPRMILLHLDGAGPFGDPYQVNSANNGPYGDAIVHELIPHVEEKFRAIGGGTARVLEGHSTGGWVSLALQVFYPDEFNGAWSHAPDPVDFRAYELINIYEDDNAYMNAYGFERPARRDINGDVAYTVRYECALERVLGRGDRWELSGKDWCAWNATFGPRGKDGLPWPIWDGVTGKMDPEVLAHWRRYDLRRVLQLNAKSLAPRLHGKLQVWVGDADDYFLNNAVHLLDTSLQQTRPDYGATFTYGPRQGHSWRGLSEAELLRAMARRANPRAAK